MDFSVSGLKHLEILNKLTPENYDVSKDQLINAGITNADILQGVTSLIFEKAVLEPTLCPMYAILCQDLSTALPRFPSDEPDGKPLAFRRILIDLCQETFEGADNLRVEIKQMTAPDREAERGYKERMVRLRTLGNIRLIGELFKQNMITESIIHRCVQKLLGQDLKAPSPSEENVEALCLLFDTVGKQLEENPKSSIINNSYFARMKELSNNPHLVSRMRLMVRNVLALRANKWAPRLGEVKAKTIKEIHSEAEQKLGLRPGTTNMRNGRGAPAIGLRGARKFAIERPGGMMLGMPGTPGTDPDGWEVFPQGQIGSKFESPMPSPARIPGQGRFQEPVIKHSVGNAKLLPQCTGGLFSGKSNALLQNSVAGPSSVPKIEAPEPLIQGSFGGPRSYNPTGFSRVEVEKYKFSAPLPVTERHVPTGKPPNDLDKKSRSLLEEYFSIQDKAEAKLCVEELKWPSYYPEFVRQAVLLAMEKTERHVELVITLLEHLFSDKTLSDRDIKEGIILVAEECDDITIDIPLAPRHLGDIVGKLTFAGATDLRLLEEAMSKVEDGHVRRTIFEAAQRAINSNPVAERVLGAESGDLKECEKLIASKRPYGNML